MLHSTQRRRTRQIETLRTQFTQAESLAFADLLPAQRLEVALRETGKQLHQQSLTAGTAGVQ